MSDFPPFGHIGGDLRLMVEGGRVIEFGPDNATSIIGVRFTPSLDSIEEAIVDETRYTPPIHFDVPPRIRTVLDAIASHRAYPSRPNWPRVFCFCPSARQREYIPWASRHFPDHVRWMYAGGALRRLDA